MISYVTGNNKFQYRAASVIVHNGKVLLQRDTSDQVWYIPGGRVEFDESAEEAIEREMLEEFNVPIVNKKLIWLVENFIEFSDRRVHEMGLFYLVHLPSGHSIYQHNDEFEGAEQGFANKWVHMEALDDYFIVPEFVVPELRTLQHVEGIKHIVNRSVRK
ncbi:NUDIX domain-containing protein [Paenibacillus sp. 1_12]|nr:NUDIX domain-containing protein [Paenibacillus sp. 1_12]